MNSLEKTSTGSRQAAPTIPNSIRLLGVLALIGLSACQSDPKLSGTWVLDEDAGTHVPTWRSIELRITATEDEVSIGRLFNPRRFTRHDSLTFPVNDTQVEIPMPGSAKWLEHPHLGVFVEDGTMQQIRAGWEEPGRVLDIQHLLTLQTSQGEATVEILRRYAASDDGSQLTVTEKRSSRPDTLTYVYRRNEE